MTLPHSLALRSIPVSHWLTLLHRVESSMSALFGRPKRQFFLPVYSMEVVSSCSRRRSASQFSYVSEGSHGLCSCPPGHTQVRDFVVPPV